MSVKRFRSLQAVLLLFVCLIGLTTSGCTVNSGNGYGTGTSSWWSPWKKRQEPARSSQYPQKEPGTPRTIGEFLDGDRPE
ncbi:MAG TPA: hypothetical protein DEB39_00530 [Planctomycetaceae bacterium]|nr:hypothetical protein [Planctomycetaceae bacterium]